MKLFYFFVWNFHRLHTMQMSKVGAITEREVIIEIEHYQANMNRIQENVRRNLFIVEV